MESSRNFIQENFKCEICDNNFSTNMSKTQHIKNVHGKLKKFSCNVCKKHFGKKETLSFYIRNYHQEGPRNFKCVFCEKSYTQSGNLKTHIKTVHEGQRNYKCDLCEKCFTESGTLKIHKEVHERQNNYRCDTCGH